MYMFFYGSLKSGYWNNDRYLKGGGGGFIMPMTTPKKYRLFQHPLSYPVMIEDPIEPLEVQGELWFVNRWAADGIDRMEKGAGYTREIIGEHSGFPIYTYVYGDPIVARTWRDIKDIWEPEPPCALCNGYGILVYVEGDELKQELCLYCN